MIEATSIGFKYKVSGYIFKNHTFRVDSGRVLAILGPNGRGKTTLLKTIIGLLPLSEGEIKIDGRIGYVPQHAAAMFPYSVLDMVVMGRARQIKLFESPKKADYELAFNALCVLGLSDFVHRNFLELSGGEKQLVLIARALVSECSVLVLDEPASALDFKNQNLILRTLKNLSRNQGLTIIFTTHFPQHAVHLADQVLLMYAPEEYRFGTAEDVLTDGHLKSLYGMEVRNILFNHCNENRRTIVPVFA